MLFFFFEFYAAFVADVLSVAFLEVFVVGAATVAVS